jgi:hypothetical protein
MERGVVRLLKERKKGRTCGNDHYLRHYQGGVLDYVKESSLG